MPASKLQSFQPFVESALLPLAERMARWPSLIAIRSAFFVVLPFIFMSSLAHLYVSFPLSTYSAFMADMLGPNWQDFAIPFTMATRILVAPMMAFIVGYQLGQQYNMREPTLFASPVIMGLVGLIVFYNLIPAASYAATEYWVGPAGLFLAIFTSIMAAKLFWALFSISFLRLHWPGASSGLAIIQSFNSFVPAILTIVIFTVINIGFAEVFNQYLYTVANNAVTLLLQDVTAGLWQAVSYIFSNQVLWFLGLHGGYMLRDIASDIYGAASLDNLNALLSQTDLPHIVTSTFLSTFAFTGGAGSFALIGALLFFGKTSSNRKLALFCLVPCLFNMDELLLFGFPVVLNPIMLIPFVLTPIISAFVSYAATYLELVPRIGAMVEWTTPVFLNAYIATDSVRGILLQAFNITLGMYIYAPFVLLANTIKQKQFQIIFDELLQLSATTSSTSQNLINRNDDVGALARSLIAEMKNDLKRGEGFFLMLQPQVCAKTKKVVSVESLIRWKNKNYGEIPTPIVIAIAEDSGLIKSLGLWVFEEACRIRKQWMDRGLKDTIVSVNVSGLQLDDNFADNLLALMQRYNLPLGSMEIEVTESRMLTTAKDESRILLNLHTSGFPLAIDDFGMGHSSLKYLRQFPVSVVKIDGAIIKDILTNPICVDIVSTIVKLCRARNMRSIAEFVETEKHAEALNALGCDILQGYLYSKPLLPDACFQYIQDINKNFQYHHVNKAA